MAIKKNISVEEMMGTSKVLDSFKKNKELIYSQIIGINKVFSQYQKEIPSAIKMLNIISQSDLQIILPNIISAAKSFSSYNNQAFRNLSKIIQEDIQKTIRNNLKLIKDIVTEFQKNNIFSDLTKTIEQYQSKKYSLPTYHDLITIDAVEWVSSDDTEQVLERISSLEAKLQKIEKKPLSLDFFRSLLISILIATIQIFMANNDKNEIISKIESKIENTTIVLTGEIKKCQENIIEGEYLVVTRQTHGYSRPKLKKIPGIILYPNQKVRLINKKGKWIFIEYFNHIENKHEQTWCLKKYFKEINLQPQPGKTQ